MFDYDFDQIARTNSSKNCPNCGAPIENEKCPYCGTVFVDFAAMDTEQPFYMKIKHDGRIYILKVKMTSAELSAETNNIYDTFGSRLLTLMPHNYR